MEIRKGTRVRLTKDFGFWAKQGDEGVIVDASADQGNAIVDVTHNANCEENPKPRLFGVPLDILSTDTKCNKN
jgi:hypothetical protein